MTADFASQAGHWYAPDGTPRYTIIGANGKERPTTLRDARKLGLLPSVTEIIKCAAKPGLERWKERQVMLAALTLPRLDGEDDESFCERVLTDSREQARKAAERGEALHAALERHARGGEPYAAEWMPHVAAAIEELAKFGISLTGNAPERSFGCAIGYGGKVDLHGADATGRAFVIDFKSKDAITDKVDVYDEHGMQLSAYGMGLLLDRPRRLNVFVGVSDARCKVIEHPEDTAGKHWQMFLSLLTYWQASRGYHPTAQAQAA